MAGELAAARAGPQLLERLCRGPAWPAPVAEAEPPARGQTEGDEDRRTAGATVESERGDRIRRWRGSASIASGAGNG